MEADRVNFAFIGQGRLSLSTGGEPTPLDSPFVGRIDDRETRQAERHGWKSDSFGWSLNPAQPHAASIDAAMDSIGSRQVRFVSVAAAASKLVYSISTGRIGGLFEYDPATGEERRLVHKAGLIAESLSVHPTTGELAFCVRNPDGSAAIAVAEPGGGRHRLVTEGDSVDEAPSWDFTGRRVVFQSAGIARHPTGVPVEQSTYRIESLDLDTEKLTLLVEDDKADYLNPRLTADGSLYVVRRPYQPRVRPMSPLRLLKDIALAPVRLAFAVAMFLNAFTTFFTRKPLFTAGGPGRSTDATPLLLWGRWIDTRKAMADPGSAGPLVPASWQLIHRTPGGVEQNIADRVIHFDVRQSNGGIDLLWTDGSRIFHRPHGGTAVEIHRGRLIERVAFTPSLPIDRAVR